MQLEAPKEPETEKEENVGDHQDQTALPEGALPSPFDVAKQDPMNVDAEKEPIASEPGAPAEQEKVNGAAQEVY